MSSGSSSIDVVNNSVARINNVIANEELNTDEAGILYELSKKLHNRIAALYFSKIKEGTIGDIQND